MTCEERGTSVDVRITAGEIADFNRRWPGSEIPRRTLTFTFDRHRNLVGIEPNPGACEGLMALAYEAELEAFPQAALR